MTRHFGYYEDWKSAVLECPNCGWKGTFEQGAVEYYSELMDCSCPACDSRSAPMLAIVSYPTVEESKANWDKLSASEKEEVNARTRFQSKCEASRLESAAQLPDLEGSSLTLTWDFESRAIAVRTGERCLTMLLLSGTVSGKYGVRSHFSRDTGGSKI